MSDWTEDAEQDAWDEELEEYFSNRPKFTQGTDSAVSGEREMMVGKSR